MLYAWLELIIVIQPSVSLSHWIQKFFPCLFCSLGLITISVNLFWTSNVGFRWHHPPSPSPLLLPISLSLLSPHFSPPAPSWLFPSIPSYLFLEPVVVLNNCLHHDVCSLHVKCYFPRLLILKISRNIMQYYQIKYYTLSILLKRCGNKTPKGSWWLLLYWVGCKRQYNAKQLHPDLSLIISNLLRLGGLMAMAFLFSLFATACAYWSQWELPPSGSKSHLLKGFKKEIEAYLYDDSHSFGLGCKREDLKNGELYQPVIGSTEGHRV